MDTTTHQARILNIPPELRLMVYELVFENVQPEICMHLQVLATKAPSHL